mmetsp:Transcript_59652/g.94706  ORF Transcript_59652/g.94706 Transcript_59652/m.94706 type:complete len:80 (+) Transcript_59652:1460-1699(+)
MEGLPNRQVQFAFRPWLCQAHQLFHKGRSCLISVSRRYLMSAEKWKRDSEVVRLSTHELCNNSMQQLHACAKQVVRNCQ